jgi:hypothetical protein
MVLAGCIRAAPAALILDDPRVQVQSIEAGQPAPARGVWMSEWTFERMLETVEYAANRGNKVN